MDQVEQVKSKTDIVSLINERVTLTKAGRNYKANCPFHSEKTPSFMVSPELQIYKCFGCGISGDAISFLEEYEGMDFAEALQYLADRAGIKLKPFRGEGFGEKQRLIQANDWAAKFYHYLLLNHLKARRALNYLKKDRGIAEQSIKTFSLGYAPDNPQVLIGFLNKKKKVHPQDLVNSGLAVKTGRGLIDRFRGRVIFPIFDHRGNTVALAGRILPFSEKPDLAKYINSPETLVYHKSQVLFGLNLTKAEIKKAKQAVVVEGELDLISSWQAGVRNVVAIKGTALTPEQIQLLSRLTDKIILALDADAAGDAAARRGISLAQETGLEVRVLRIKKYKDPDEFSQHDPQGYQKAIANSVSVWDFLIDQPFEKYDSQTGDGKAKISREVVPVLISIPDKIVQAHYLKQVAEKLGVDQDAVIKQIEQFSRKRTQTRPKVIIPKQPKSWSRKELLEQRLLTLGFQVDPKILGQKEVKNLLTEPLSRRLLQEFRRFFKSQKKFSVSKFADSLPRELVKGFSELVLEDLGQEILEPGFVKKEVALIIKELKIIDIKERLTFLSGQIRELENQKESQKLNRVKTEFSRLSQELAELEEAEIPGIIG